MRTVTKAAVNGIGDTGTYTVRALADG